MAQGLLVMLGAFFGSISRYLISKKFNCESFPYGTLFINLLGAFLLGLLFDQLELWTLLLGTGFMGSFTTFSTFNVENLEMVKKKRWKRFVTYLVITYIGGLFLAWVGLSI